MKKVIGVVLIIVGLFLIGLGSFNEFELFEEDLMRHNKKNYYDGLYLTSGDSIIVKSQSEDVIKVLINDETYSFVYNGTYYEDEYSGFYILFSDDELSLFKDGEKIRTLHKEKK